MSTDLQDLAIWLRMLAIHAEAGHHVGPETLRRVAREIDALAGRVPAVKPHPRAPFWRRWMRRRFV